mgnify:FL=1
MSIEVIAFLQFIAWAILAALLYGLLEWAGPRTSFLNGRKEKRANEKERGA